MMMNDDNIYLSIVLLFYCSIVLLFYLSIYLSIVLLFYCSIYLSIVLSTYRLIDLVLHIPYHTIPYRVASCTGPRSEFTTSGNTLLMTRGLIPSSTR